MFLGKLWVEVSGLFDSRPNLDNHNTLWPTAVISEANAGIFKQMLPISFSATPVKKVQPIVPILA